MEVGLNEVTFDVGGIDGVRAIDEVDACAAGEGSASDEPSGVDEGVVTSADVLNIDEECVEVREVVIVRGDGFERMTVEAFYGGLNDFIVVIGDAFHILSGAPEAMFWGKDARDRDIVTF